MDQTSSGHDATTAAAVGTAAGESATTADITPAPNASSWPTEQLTLWEKLTATEKATTEAEAPHEHAEVVQVAEKPKRQARKLADIAEREAKAAAKEQELAKYQADVEEYRKTLEQLKTDPLGALEKAGLTYEQLTMEALKGKRGQPNPEVVALKEEFRKELDGIKAADQERQISGAKAQLRTHIEASGDKYELTVARGDFDRVWETMVQITQQSNGKHIPTFDEAAEFWESQLEKEAEKFMTTKKIQAKIAKPAAEKVEIASKEVVAKQAAKPVLSNKIGAPAAPVQQAKPKTRADAFSAFRNLVDKAYRGEVVNK
jgi:hypothetical protein